VRRCLSALLLGAVALAPSALPVRAALPPVRINAEGTFKDVGVWIVETADKKFRYLPGTIGTNEAVAMPAPALAPGETLSASMRIRHGMRLYGYPMQLSMLEKLFATTNHVTAMDSIGDDMRKYEPGTPFPQEIVVNGPSPGRFTADGPMPANGPIPAADKDAFAYATGALASIENLPADQKDLAHYAVMFIDDGTSIWVEFGPSFGPTEAPHLGCQTLEGRDMVFAYGKQMTPQGRGGAFLQCF